MPMVLLNQHKRYVMNLWDLPSSLSTSFCNFCTDLSANSARASAWQNKDIVKNHHFIILFSVNHWKNSKSKIHISWHISM